MRCILSRICISLDVEEGDYNNKCTNVLKSAQSEGIACISHPVAQVGLELVLLCIRASARYIITGTTSLQLMPLPEKISAFKAKSVPFQRKNINASSNCDLLGAGEG